MLHTITALAVSIVYGIGNAYATSDSSADAHHRGPESTEQPVSSSVSSVVNLNSFEMTVWAGAGRPEALLLRADTWPL